MARNSRPLDVLRATQTLWTIREVVHRAPHELGDRVRLPDVAELVHVSHGIWRPAPEVASLAGRVAAILQALPEGTVVAGLTAARLHGLWLPQCSDDPIEVIVHPETAIPRQRSHNRRPGVRARRQMLQPDEITVIDGLLLTTAARTWLDLAAALSPADLTAAGDSALRGLATVNDLTDVVLRATRRRGVIRARMVLPLLDARSRSRPESHLRYALVSRRLPVPDVNAAIYDEHGQWLAEPDLSYDDVRLALEYNGADHAATTRMRRDITRVIDVGHRGGWRTETFGPVEVFGRPDQVAAYVRELRRERSRLFG